MTTRPAEALRRLLLVAAALCLLGAGGLDLLRPSAGAAPAAAVGTGTGAEPVPPATVSALRSALAAAVPLLGGDLAPPTAGPVPAAHPVGDRGAADDVRVAPGATVEGPDGRGPPRTAGT